MTLVSMECGVTVSVPAYISVATTENQQAAFPMARLTEYMLMSTAGAALPRGVAMLGQNSNHQCTYFCLAMGCVMHPRAYSSILFAVLSGRACCKTSFAVLLLTTQLPTGVARWEVHFPS